MAKNPNPLMVDFMVLSFIWSDNDKGEIITCKLAGEKQMTAK